MVTSRLEYLFNCYIRHDCTAQEQEELMTLLAQPENQVAVQTLIDQTIENTGVEMQMPDQVATTILQNILRKDKDLVLTIKNRRTVFPPWMRVAAAVLIFMLGTLIYLFFDKKDAGKAKAVQVAEKNSPVLPETDQVLLTMSDGSTIVLDSMQNGTIWHGNTKINKQGTLLVYNELGSPAISAPDVYNTLSTPKGAQYQIVLPDGSSVWMNSSSALHFPTAFTGNERDVELAGEAYFEVAKNKKPFRVKVGEMYVEVLGTHFNINAYADESVIKTSLLEGSVKITKGKTTNLLKPGQQATLNKIKDKAEIADADMIEVMAWKNGLFHFEGADITAVMREIARWYNIEIVYAGKIPVRRFRGKISRRARLSEVLEILKLSDIKFSVEGQKIIVQ